MLGQNSNNIDHQDTASPVTAVASGSSSTPTSSSTPISSSTPTSSTTPTPKVPEFSSTIIIALLIASAIAVAIFAAKKLNKNKIAASYAPLNIN